MMRRGRASTGLCGILAVDKPAGMTSHDVVDSIRSSTRERRIGHAGTLDPLATGLLVVLVGPATRLAPYLSAADKSYRARISFGLETDTDDATGDPVRDLPVPPDLTQAERAQSVVDGLIGTHQQLPPAYSAVKREGRIAHREARSGRPLDLAPRSIEILDARLVDVDSGPPICWDLELTVSKGTYIRAIARDLGRSLDTAAYLGALRRLTSGSLHVDTAHPLDEIVSATGSISTLFADSVAALNLPVISVSAGDAELVSFGRPLDVSVTDVGVLPAGPVIIADTERMLGVYRSDTNSGKLRPEVVIPGGVSL